MKRRAILLAATLLFGIFSPLSAPASAAPTLTQVNEPALVGADPLYNDASFRGIKDLHQLTPPSSGNWDLVGAWNFNNTQSQNELVYSNDCRLGNNSSGPQGPVDNKWGALAFNSISNYGKDITSTLYSRPAVSPEIPLVNTGISLSTSIRSLSNLSLTHGCTTVFNSEDYYLGKNNPNATSRRTTETINGSAYVYPESYFRVVGSPNSVWTNTFSHLDKNKKYRFQFVYSSVNDLNENVLSETSVSGIALETVNQDVSADLPTNQYRHKNRITVEFAGADTYTLSRTNLTGSAAMVLNAFTIYEEQKTPTTTSITTSTSSPNYGSPVTLSATVAPAATGAVTFLDAANEILCTGALSSGTASCDWTPSGSGATTVRASYEGDPTYASSISANLVIVVKEIATFTWNGNTKTYGDPSFTISSPISGTPGTYSYASSNVAVVSISSTTATVKAAGSATITATFTPTDTTNFATGTTTSMAVTVNPATLTATASSPIVAYGGAAPNVTAAYSGFIGNDSASDISGINCSPVGYTNTSAVGSSIATNCSGGTAANYTLQYVSGALSIIKANAANDLYLTSLAATYGTDLSLSATGGLGDGAFIYQVNSGPCEISSDGQKLISSANGTCSLTVTKSASANYEALTSGPFSVIVARKNLTIGGLTGVDKQYDGLRSSSQPIGVPNIVGLVGSDVVTLSGTPEFLFADSNASNGITVQGSGYSLTDTDADKYTLTQPSVLANISRKTATVTAANVTVGRGQVFSSSISAAGLVSPDQVSTATYRYSTGTSTPPTSSGVTAITPSFALLSPGDSNNYNISYVDGTLQILDEYTVSFDANLGEVNPTSATFQIGGASVSLPTPIRENFNFDGWFDESVTPNVEVTGSSYSPSADKTLVAHWTQLSLLGLTNPVLFGTIRATTGLDGGISAARSGTRVEVDYFADTLPDGTMINAYLQGDTTIASSLLTRESNILLSVVIAWIAPNQTVPDIDASNSAIRLKISNTGIKAGANIYSIIGRTSQLIGTASADGWATIELRRDPEIVIANPAVLQQPNNIVTAPPAATGPIATEPPEKIAPELPEKLPEEANVPTVNFTKPKISLYSISSSFKLNTRDYGLLKKFASTLKPRTKVTCVGYIYPSSKSFAAARSKANSQAKAVCAMLVKLKPSIKVSTVLLPVSKAPKAAAQAKWQVGSFRVDGF